MISVNQIKEEWLSEMTNKLKIPGTSFSKVSKKIFTDGNCLSIIMQHQHDEDIESHKLWILFLIIVN